MVKNIVFDIGNVLLRFEPVLYVKGLVQDQEIANQVYHAIFESEEWAMLDAGTITQEEAVKKFVQRNPNCESQIVKCMEGWMELLNPIEENVAVLRELKEQGYNLYMLSNFHDLAFKYIYNRYDFFGLFDGGIISYEHQLLKPQPEIYQKLLDTYNLNPQETLFIDDTKVNVEAAEKLGFHIIHHTDCDTFHKQLNSLIRNAS